VGDAPAAGGTAAGGVQHNRRLRRLRSHRGLGRGASRVSARDPALSIQRARRPLAEAAEEPHRSRAVLGLLDRLGAQEPDQPDFVAIDGKTSWRSHDRSTDKAPLHLVSAFATTSRLVLGQEAVSDKSNETAIPALQRLAAHDGLQGAVVSIDAIACNATIATAIKDAGADYLLVVKANQPILRAEIEDYSDTASFDHRHHYRPRQGTRPHRGPHRHRQPRGRLAVGRPPLPRELRLPIVATITKVRSHAKLKDPLPHRHPLLHLLRPPHRQGRRHRRSRPLRHRKPTALGPRFRLPRRPSPPQKRTWRQRHGHRQTLRHQPHPHPNR